jgi:hypothetical protein
MENITVVGLKKTEYHIEMGYTHNGDAKICVVVIPFSEDGVQGYIRFLDEENLPKGVSAKMAMMIMADSYLDRKIKEGACSDKI